MVVNFRYEQASLLLRELGYLIRVSHANMIDMDRRGGSLSPFVINDPELSKALDQSKEAVDACVVITSMLFEEVNNRHIDDANKQLGNWDRSEISLAWPQLNRRSIALRNAVEIELKGHYYFVYSKEKGAILKRWKIEWHQCITSFPEIEAEIFEAIDCFALEKNTASVFHSMRVAEIGLRAIAKERNLVFPKGKMVEWANWQEIITALDAEIKAIGLKKACMAKDQALAFYSGARADINGFKDEYRNLVMHVRSTYDEFQANRAMFTVRNFMNRISIKIDERSLPVDWSFP